MGVLEHLNIRAMNTVLTKYNEDLDIPSLYDYEAVLKINENV
jgi:hypothetical protein